MRVKDKITLELGLGHPPPQKETTLRDSFFEGAENRSLPKPLLGRKFDGSRAKSHIARGQLKRSTQSWVRTAPQKHHTTKKRFCLGRGRYAKGQP